MTTLGESGMLTLTKRQAEHVRSLLHNARSEVGLDVSDACTLDDFEQLIAQAQELLLLWRALDGGMLPLTPGTRRLLERELEFLTSTLPHAEQALEQVRAGEDPFGGTPQEQEAYVLAYIDDVIGQLWVLRQLLFAADNPGLPDPESAARA